MTETPLPPTGPPTPASPPPPAPRRWGRRWGRRWLGHTLRWALAAGVVALAARFLAGLDWQDLGTRISGAERSWIAVATLCLLGRWLVWAHRWRLAATRLGGAPGTLRLGLMVIASAALNHLTPAARVLGSLLRARYLAHATGRSLGRAFGSVLFDQVAHQISMTGMTVAALAVAAWSLGRPAVAAGATAVVVLLSAGLTIGWVRLRAGGGKRLGELARRLAVRAQRPGGLRRRRGWGARASRVLDGGREAVTVLRRLLDDGGLLLHSVLLGIVYALVNAAALWAVFRALGDDLSLAVVLASVALGVAAGALVGTPGGLGAAEAAIVASLVALGVDRVDATAATLLYRGLHYVTVFGGGLPALALLELRRRRQRRSEGVGPTGKPTEDPAEKDGSSAAGG